MNDMERKFEADQLLMERDFHTTLLEPTDAAFESGRKAMASLTQKPLMSLTVGMAYFCLIGKSSCAGLMFWSRGRPTSTLIRRKNFVRRSFAPVPASIQELVPHPLLMCLKIHQRGKLERSKLAMMLPMKRRIFEGL